ncbi:MAG TPA: hypothetical protein VF552_10710 [Allosphingosinicella sp.]|jgi:hypothetical protein
MVTVRNWLDEVVVLNESPDEAVPGEVSIHRSVGDALRAIKPWWVENEEGFAFSATGVRLVLRVAPSGEVIVARREEIAEGPAIVLSWLQALAQATLETRRRVAGTGRVWLSRAEEEGALPLSVEGMLAYIGLPWVAPRNWLVPSCLILLTLVALLLALILAKLL